MPEAPLPFPAVTAPMLEADGVSRYFDVSRPALHRLLAREPRAVLRAVDDVSFAIPRGSTLALVGESGCGKSTVARMAVGLLAPSAGEIRFEGRPLNLARADAKLRRRMNMIFQDPYASLNPRWRVRDIVAEPIRAFGLLRGAMIRDRIAALLEQVGLSVSDGERYPHEFSGGQRQRISIARALSSEPEFLVCDEPTSALDVSVQAQILNLMRELQGRLGLTYLFISHNLAVVRHMADRLGVMYLGRIVEMGPGETVFRTPLHPYTRLLLDAIPDLEMIGRPRTPVGGEVPSPIAPPPGCPFHPRCPLANQRCRVEKPAHTRAGDTLVACHAVEENRLRDA
jgi:peptide/nickel transport system ATP-binding protein